MIKCVNAFHIASGFWVIGKIPSLPGCKKEINLKVEWRLRGAPEGWRKEVLRASTFEVAPWWWSSHEMERQVGESLGGC